MFSDLYKIALPTIIIVVLSLMVWIQLMLRIWGKTLKGWLPTFFGATLLVALGLIMSVYWDFTAINESYSPLLWRVWGPRMAQGGFYTGLVYIGVTLWLHLFEWLMKRK